MRAEIDQSGKIEQTNKSTVIALANDQTRTLKITSTEKHRLILAVKRLEYPKKNYIYRLFATLVFILLKDRKAASVIIDTEYQGHESVIKDTLIFLFSKNSLILPEIHFGRVGKKSRAHKEGLAVFQGKHKAQTIIKAEEVLKSLYTKEKWLEVPL